MDDGSLFCSGCGSKVEINNTVKQTQTSAATENKDCPQTEYRSYAEPKKNAAAGVKIIVIAAIAAVVLAGGGFFIWQMMDNQKSVAAEQAQAQAEEDARLAAEQAEEDARLAAEQAQAEEDARLAVEQAQAEAEKVRAEAEKALATAKRQVQQAKSAEAKAKAETEQIRLAAEASAADEAKRKELEAEIRRMELEMEERRLMAELATMQKSKKPATTQAAPAPTQVTLAAGTPIKVITSSEISTKSNKAGDGFTVILNEDITQGGRIIARRGAAVRGVIFESDPGGRVKGVATMSLRLSGLTLNDGGQAAIITNEYSVDAPGSVGKDVGTTAAASGLGAAIGAIAGGGKGAAIGAGAGAAGGVGVALATRGNPAVIEPETVITFNLAAPLIVTMK